MKLWKNCRKLTTALSRFWHREAGPMNWKNPVRVTAYIGWEIFNGVAFLVGEWVRYGVRSGQLFLEIPPTVIFFFGGAWYAVWHFVRRPFPALETVPLLDQSRCSIFWNITTRIFTAPLWFGTTFRPWWW